MTKKSLFLAHKGFTLIELLVVIGILAVLLAITLVAINPARQFSQANDTQRQSDVNAILNAVTQFMADNNGTPPAGIPEAPADAALISDTGADICALLVPLYLAALPTDPTDGSITNTGGTVVGEPVTEADCDETYTTAYTIVRDATGRITVSAPEAELAADISVTR